MCIVLVSTAHPSYPLILLSNRDEFLDRPTARADWWAPPAEHVLAGRDLQRTAHGTWLGVTRQGRVAALTNFREPHPPPHGAEHGHGHAEERSRGEIPKAFLAAAPAAAARETDAQFAARFMDTEHGFAGVGGFSFVFGTVRRRGGASGAGGGKGEGGVRFGVISNRTRTAQGVVWVDEPTWGLSNSHYGDRAWPKVISGEEMLARAVRDDAGGVGEADVDGFIERLFKVLEVDTLPRRKPDEGWTEYTEQLRQSVFIPPFGGDGDPAINGHGDGVAEKQEIPGYGTVKQTVILIDQEGTVKLVEKTLFEDGKPTNGDVSTTRTVEFEIEGWNEHAVLH